MTCLSSALAQECGHCRFRDYFVWPMVPPQCHSARMWGQDEGSPPPSSPISLPLGRGRHWDRNSLGPPPSSLHPYPTTHTLVSRPKSMETHAGQLLQETHVNWGEVHNTFQTHLTPEVFIFYQKWFVFLVFCKCHDFQIVFSLSSPGWLAKLQAPCSAAQVCG